MLRSKKNWLRLTVLLSGLATGLSALPALARGNGAVLGRAQFARNQGCFEESNGGIINNCTTAKEWIMPLVVDVHGGELEIRVRAITPTASTKVICRAHSIRPDGVLIWGTDDETDHSGLQTLIMNVGSTEAINYYAHCVVDPKARIVDIEYLYIVE